MKTPDESLAEILAMLEKAVQQLHLRRLRTEQLLKMLEARA